MTSKRDGFVVRDDKGEEIHFVACAHTGSNRERVLMGMLRNLRENYTIGDTRDDD